MPTGLVVGIDVGTRSTKGVLVSADDGAVLATATRDHGVVLRPDGGVEQDADAIWWDETRDVCSELAARAPAGTEVRALGLSACGPCLVPVDASGRALRPAMLYGIDTRAVEHAAELDIAHPDATERFGMPFSSQSLTPKRRWVERHEPEVASEATGWLTANGFLALRLTGRGVLDRHQAAYWAPDVPDDAGWSDAVAGELTAAGTGLPAGIPVVIGSSDGATDPIGAGVGAGPVALLRYGSTLGMTITTTGHGQGVDGLWRTPGNHDGETMYVGGLSTAGSVTSWFREQLGSGRTYEQLLAEAAGSPIGAGGVLALPYFAGERTPFRDPHARGVFAGLGLATTRGDLYRAVLEGAALGLRHLLGAALAGGLEVTSARAVGGGAGALWTRIVSDATGLTQEVVEPQLGAPLGAARLAAEGAGLITRDAAPWVRVTRVVTPDPEAAHRYDELFPLFRQLYEATREVVAGVRTVVR